MKKLVAIAAGFVVSAGLMLAADSITGWVSDATCHKSGAAHKACAQKCAAKGDALVLVTDDGKVTKIHNPEAVKDHVGDKVTAMGNVADGAIHIDSVQPGS